ncbi:shikimate kinase [Campylobacter sp. faydin G-24]|uniref:Shikimate kinase n=1 Tax=Campylobacter anatolicus TaxID=2829105 RepID=A0ABS5HGQ6_9BACT|nr:shikimate kinase [Campylobacter anatolicus]MBR8463459.1 shikimate kinase [Campylobacter anatolicus]MBR8465188.1 shikimate kinase [Campylobacter anatolicus]
MTIKNDNIVFIGFMGVGKGTIGRLLSKNLDKFFLDCDDMLESSQNKKIVDIFEAEGEEHFRNLEKKLAKFLATNVKNAVISTGGGFANVKYLNKIGTIIYLKSSFDAIIQRLKNSPNSDKKFAKRPLLRDLNRAREIHKNREKIYTKKADIIINVENKTPKQIVKEIKERLAKDKN